MRDDDIIYLLLSQHEGEFYFKEAWLYLANDYPFKHETEWLPPLLIFDLNGDGWSEILVATHDAKIQVRCHTFQIMN